eukprot:COSAG04_NODE_16034_length_512_cov_0.445521_2_plen_109_part_01
MNNQVEQLRGIVRYPPSVTSFFSPPWRGARVAQSSFLTFGLVAPWILMISMVKTSTPATRPLSPYARLDGMYISHLSPATTAPDGVSSSEKRSGAQSANARVHTVDREL